MIREANLTSLCISSIHRAQTRYGAKGDVIRDRIGRGCALVGIFATM